MKHGLMLTVFFVGVALALVLRVDQLGLRPMHNDEAVNALKFQRLYSEGVFEYDPLEYHGPTLFYFTSWIERAARAPAFPGFSEARLRGITVFFGVAMVPLVWLLRRGLGRQGTGWAMVFLAVSPAFTFYSRYFIHEILLACFTLLTLGAAWRYWRSRKAGWAILAGIGLGLMQATKETFVLSVGAALGALLINHVWNRKLDASGLPLRAPRLAWSHVGLGIGAWLIVVVLFFTSFFTNSRGLSDIIRAYLPYTHRAGGQTMHVQPWYFYFQRLLFFHSPKGPIWSEGIILLLGLTAGVSAFLRKGLSGISPSLVRFLVLYTCGLAAAYSVISYKTPWCLLQFWLGMILLAGVGAALVTQSARYQWARVTSAILVGSAALQLAGQAWQAGHAFAADQRNPYVYSPTSRDLLKLVDKITALSQVSTERRELLIKVIATEGDYWPLPWYFRQFNRIGYFDTLPSDPYASVMIVSAGLHAALEEKRTHVMIGYFELRPGVFLELYAEIQLWRAYLSRQPEPDDR